MGEQAQGLCGELCGSRAAVRFRWPLWFCVFSCSRAPRPLFRGIGFGPRWSAWGSGASRQSRWHHRGVNLLEEKKVKPQRFILKTLL